MPAPSVIVFPSPQRNIKFLQAVIGSDWPEAHVTGFVSDPDDKTCADANSRWIGGRWSNIGAGLTADMNTFFSVSTYTGEVRGKEFFKACHAIVLDDVGTPEVSAADVLAALGDPSWRLMTSPGNEQWGYALSPPETNIAKVEAILDALIDQNLTDAGGQNVTRYVRLPVGTNTKARHGPPFVHVPQPEPSPLRRFRSDELLTRLAVPDLDRDWTAVGASGLRRGWVSAQDLTDGGLIIRTLDAWGDLTGTRTRDGGWHLRCPWDAEHTVAGDNRAAVWPWGTFKCFHGHCVGRGRDEFLAWFNQKLADESAGLVEHLAQLEFDRIEPGQVPGLKHLLAAGTALLLLGDPWRKPLPPLWPGNVFAPAFEAEMAKLAAQNGMDLGALGVCFMLAASGAADKRARLAPFAGVDWQVPPVLWAMLIGHSGNLKTPMMNLALRRLVVAHKSNMARYRRAMRAWDSKTKAEKAVEPRPEPVALVVKNSSVESLQVLLSNNERGLIETRDELAGKFDFGRYSSGGQGDAERAFLMEAYEGEYHDVFRMSRITYAESSALTLLGGIQPDRLGDFKGLDKDGFIQRFISCVLRDAGVPDPRVVPDMTVLDDAMDRVLSLTPIDGYETDAEGEALIRETWERGKLLSAGPFLTAGFRGFSSKLHGTHARAALILHLMDGGQGVVIPRDTVIRAARFTDFAQRHAQTFYFGLEGTAEAIAQSIASYLLRYPAPKLTTRLLKRNVRPCRKMTTKDMQTAVEPLVHDGWLEPESAFMNNKTWVVNPEIKTFDRKRVAHEIERNEIVKNAMNPTRA